DVRLLEHRRVVPRRLLDAPVRRNLRVAQEREPYGSLVVLERIDADRDLAVDVRRLLDDARDQQREVETLTDAAQQRDRLTRIDPDRRRLLLRRVVDRRRGELASERLADDHGHELPIRERDELERKRLDVGRAEERGDL